MPIKLIVILKINLRIPDVSLYRGFLYCYPIVCPCLRSFQRCRIFSVKTRKFPYELATMGLVQFYHLLVRWSQVKSFPSEMFPNVKFCYFYYLLHHAILVPGQNEYLGNKELKGKKKKLPKKKTKNKTQKNTVRWFTNW